MSAVAENIQTEMPAPILFTDSAAAKVVEHWDFYIAYNMFRLAGILQGIMKRYVDGTAASAHAADAGMRAKSLAEIGWRYAQRIA